jgi:hypothetical protein
LYDRHSTLATEAVCHNNNNNIIVIILCVNNSIDGQRADPMALLSYATPTINTKGGIRGCTYDPNYDTVTDCPRNSSTVTPPAMLTIEGDNFGLSGASVFVSGVRSTLVIHDRDTPNSKLTALIPEGRGDFQLVMITQDKGNHSSPHQLIHPILRICQHLAHNTATQPNI